jgi:hypothetical protein
MSDLWTDRLSEYLDGELAPDERAALEAHLTACAECRAVLDDLERVVSRARTLDDRLPERDLWPGIAERIGRRRAAPRRWTFSLPQLAAASIALMALSGGAGWLLRPGTTGTPFVARPAAPPVIRNASDRRARAGGYDEAVADLERVLESGRGRLDSSTVRVLERNLATIDSALVQARRAVAADSANVYLNSHLAETMRRKLELLRQAADLVSAVS